MNADERALACALLAAEERAGSVWRFTWRPLLLGVTLSAMGLYVIFTASMRMPGSGAPLPLADRVMLILASLFAVAGVAVFGYGVVRVVLGSLMAGRGKAARAEAIGVLRAEVDAGLVDEIGLTLSGATRIGVGARWIARAGEHLIGVAGGDLSGAGQSALLERIELVVLPTSRRVLKCTCSGVPVALTGATLDDDEIPDFARGYRPLRPDHFSENAQTKLP